MSLTHSRGRMPSSACDTFLWTLSTTSRWCILVQPSLKWLGQSHTPFPPISSLFTSIIDSADRFFFVSHLLGNPSVHKWRLVHVALSNSTPILPSCLQDGRFLVKFFTLHYDDIRFNATNQCYWLQYHPAGDIIDKDPSDTAVGHFPSPC